MLHVEKQDRPVIQIFRRVKAPTVKGDLPPVIHSAVQERAYPVPHRSVGDAGRLKMHFQMGAGLFENHVAGVFLMPVFIAVLFKKRRQLVKLFGVDEEIHVPLAALMGPGVVRRRRHAFQDKIGVIPQKADHFFLAERHLQRRAQMLIREGAKLAFLILVQADPVRPAQNGFRRHELHRLGSGFGKEGFHVKGGDGARFRVLFSQ